MILHKDEILLVWNQHTWPGLEINILRQWTADHQLWESGGPASNLVVWKIMQ